MNKKGADKIISVYWFAVLLIVAGAVVSMVSIFYNSPYDVREIEGNLMVNKVTRCISEQEVLNSEIFEKDFNVLNYCKFKEEVFESDSEKGSEYYLELNILNFSNGKNHLIAKEGNFNLKLDCNIEDEDYEELSKCVERKFYSLDENKNLYEVKILSIVRKVKQNVK